LGVDFDDVPAPSAPSSAILAPPCVAPVMQAREGS
jgi:hypothetical protein